MPSDPSASKPAASRPNAQPIRPDLWLLEEKIAHLNHGSYGAVPTPVLEAQRAASEEIERSPERFYRAELFDKMTSARESVAEFLGTDPEGLALVQNATEATQIALDALNLRQGDEIVCTDLTYPWVLAAVERVAQDVGVVPRIIALPAQGSANAEEFAAAVVAAFEAALTDRTALVVIDQITSSTALRLPVGSVCAALGDRVPIMVDGAHAPGLISAPVPAGAAFWFGNMHKWAFSARTAAALVVAPAFRERVRPPVASYGGSLGYPRSFSYLGTQDPTAYLSLPAALAFPQEYLDLTFSELRERNAWLLSEGFGLLADRLCLAVPQSDGLPLGATPLGVAGDGNASWQLGGKLRERGVEAAITSVQGQLHIRLSVQAYVGLADFEQLADALLAEGIGG